MLLYCDLGGRNYKPFFVCVLSSIVMALGETNFTVQFWPNYYCLHYSLYFDDLAYALGTLLDHPHLKCLNFLYRCLYIYLPPESIYITGALPLGIIRLNFSGLLHSAVCLIVDASPGRALAVGTFRVKIRWSLVGPDLLKSYPNNNYTRGFDPTDLVQ